MSSKNILVVIPARAGSERVHKKNLAELDGKSLVQLAYECAAGCSEVTRIVVSTDDPEMAAGFPFVLRPSEISGPDADIADATKHALTECENIDGRIYDFIVTLQPAIPVRKPSLISALLKRVISSESAGGVTGVEVVPWLWSAEGGAAKNGWYPDPYPRSQQFASQKIWQEINACQVARRDVALAGRRWGLPLAIELMPSYAVIDIDTPDDLERAKVVYPMLMKAYHADNFSDGFVVHTINASGES